MRWITILIAAWLIPAVGAAQSAAAAKDTSPHSSAELASDFGVVPPGEEFTLALRLKMDPEWHSYWLNPGDAGMPTTIKWESAEGVTIGELQYPAPHYIPTPPLASYGYEDEVLLLMDAKLSDGAKSGQTVTLKGRADWLVCKEVCLPAREEVSLTLRVGGEIEENQNWVSAIAKARAAIPVAASEVAGLTVRAARSEGGYLIAVSLPAGADAMRLGEKDVRFFARDPQTVQHAGEQIRRVTASTVVLSVPDSEYATGPKEQLRGVLTVPEDVSWKTGEGIHAISFEAPVEPVGSIVLPAAGTGSGAVSSTLLVILLSAFVGGMILNLMPCVFPVLSLKIMSFVQQAGEDRAKIRNHGFAFAAGVLGSFWVLAGALLLLRAGGEQLGWGFQLQSPVFVALMALLIFGLGLSMAGVFEIGSSLTRLGSSGAQQGYGGSFFSGVLATAVATPCTAPFMGSALGYAISQPAAESMLVFSALGAGMATPYLMLSLNPRLMKFLPRPGAWMETLKQVLSFPLFATAIWLLWVFGLQTGIDGATGLLVAMLFLGIGGWIYGKWNEYTASGGTLTLARVLAVLALAAGLGFAWNATQQGLPAAGGSAAVHGDWQPYSNAKLESLLAAKETVFVDFTAAWCLTCQVNKRTVLHRDSIEAAFRDKGVKLLIADWTNKDPEIAAKIEELGRSGVPVYALYRQGASNPELLPELLTESIVLDALAGLPARPMVSQRQ